MDWNKLEATRQAVVEQLKGAPPKSVDAMVLYSMRDGTQQTWFSVYIWRDGGLASGGGYTPEEAVKEAIKNDAEKLPALIERREFEAWKAAKQQHTPAA